MLFNMFFTDLCYLPDQITSSKAAALISLSVLTVGLNSLVIITIWKDPFKELKGTANCLILNLAVCDLLVGIPAELLFAFLHWFPSDKKHDIIVQAAYSTMYLVFYASILTILALAVERLIVISPQFRSAHYSTTTYRTIGILSIWLFAVLLAFLPVLGWDSCHKFRMFIADAIGVPIFILVFACYTRIYLLVRKELHRDFTDEQRGELQRLTASGQRRERLKRKERHVAFSVFILVGLFAVCGTPTLVMANIIELCRNCIPHRYDLIFHCLIFMHPVANPIAYALRTAKFRRALKRIFRSG